MADTISYKARVTYTAGKTTYSFPFLYLKKKFVKVRYISTDGNYTELSYPADYKVEEKQIVLSTAGNTSDTIMIYRQTPTDQIVDYVDATVLKAYDLNVNQIQILHILEEQQDAVLTAGGSAYVYDALQHRIENLADPVNDKDAVNKEYLMQYVHDVALTLEENADVDKANWDGEKRRLTQLADPYGGQDAVTLAYLLNYALKTTTVSVLDDFFEIDVNGDITPTENPTYSNQWELDDNGDIMYREGVA